MGSLETRVVAESAGKREMEHGAKKLSIWRLSAINF